MAVVYPNANGNWSTVANWYSGGLPYGSLPQAADNVFANGKTVAIDVASINVATISNAASAPALVGGTFTCSITTTITATINQRTDSTAGNTLTLTPSSGNTITIIGNINGGSAGGNSSCITNSGLGTLNITGNLYCTVYGSSSSGALTNSGICNITGNVSPNGFGNSSGGQGFVVNNNGTLTVNGIVTGGFALMCGIQNSAAASIVNLIGTANPTTSNASGSPLYNTSTGTINISTTQTVTGTTGGYVVVNQSTGIVNINANINGSVSGTPSLAYYAINNSTGTINITGNVNMQSVSPSTTLGIIQNASTGTINVTGNVNGGSVANTIAISNASTGTINITGNVTSGSNATNTPAIYNTSTGTITVNGSTVANAYPALFSTNTGAKFNLLGNINNVGGIPAYYGSFNIKISPSVAQQFTFQDTNNANRILATSNISPGSPTPADVRFGTIYGSVGEYTGTLRVPNPNTVLLGNLTDNTTGTLLMTPSDFWNAATSGMTTSGSIGERLKNASTVQTTGDQLASYQV